MSNVLGNHVQFEIFGESHGPCIGGILSGLDAGVCIDLVLLQKNMAKRSPGSSPYVTSRHEADQVEFLSGVFEGKTTGAPLCFIIRNQEQVSKDYAATRYLPRPSHADYTAFVRYGGHQDHRGGGHFSGRLTAAVVAAGSIAEQINTARGIRVYSHLLKLGDLCDRSYYDGIDETALKASWENPYQAVDPNLSAEIETVIDKMRCEQDSLGGQVETVVYGLDAGIGSPFFGSVESRLAAALYAIPGVKGLEFGRGFELSVMRGSTANDPFCITPDGIDLAKNDSGGINGGITNGAPIVFNMAFRPTPSIGKEQYTVDLETGQAAKLSVAGRHDPAFVLRTPAVVRAMTHLVLLDMR